MTPTEQMDIMSAIENEQIKDIGEPTEQDMEVMIVESLYFFLYQSNPTRYDK